MKTIMIAATGIGSSISKNFVETLKKKNVNYKIFFFTTKKKISNDKNIEIITVKKFFSNISNYKKIINKCDYFLHFSYQNSEKFAQQNNITDLKINVIGLKNILNTCKTNKKLIFVFLSSVSLYKSSLKKISEKSDLKILSFYNLHKNFCEKLINYFISFSKNRFIILRLSNVYGDTDNTKRDFFLNSCLNIIKNNNLKIFSHGKYLRDFLHLDDVSNAIICILKKRIHNKLEVYNLGYGKSFSVNYLIKRIILNLKKRKIYYKGNIKFTKNKSQLVNRNFSTEASKFKKKFNWKPVINLDSGIDKVISKIL